MASTELELLIQTGTSGLLWNRLADPLPQHFQNCISAPAQLGAVLSNQLKEISVVPK